MSSSQVAAVCAGLFIMASTHPCSAGRARFARTTYLTTNASENIAARLRRSLLVSKLEKRLFHKVQRKQKDTIQNAMPLSGITELKTWTLAAKRANSVIALIRLLVISNRSEIQPSNRIRFET